MHPHTKMIITFAQGFMVTAGCALLGLLACVGVFYVVMSISRRK